MSKVVLFCPICVDAETLVLALASHISIKGVEIERWYYDDNSFDMLSESSRILASERRLGARILPSLPLESKEGPHYRNEDTHNWNFSNISRVARIKNYAIEEFLKSDADYLFFVDADVVIHPQVVSHLEALNRDVVSEVFWTKWGKTDEMYMPQVWDVHPYAHIHPESITRLAKKGLYEVGGLGACTLVHRRVLEAGVNFDPLVGIGFEGEDRWFCIRAVSAGFKLLADTHYAPFHVYRPSQLEEAKMWWEQGCDPEYFREVWLADLEEAVKNRIANKGASKSIALCIPGEQFSAAWVMGIINALPAMNCTMDLQIFNVFGSDASITRQNITKMVLDSDKTFDYVLWVDDDNVISEAAVKTLIEDLDAYPDIDLVAGWCDIAYSQYCNAHDYTRNQTSCGTFNSEGRCVYLTHDEVIAATGLVKIDFTGFPCVMMRGSLLQRLGPKCFRKIFDDALEWGMYGEDVSFCKRANDIGAVLTLDPRVRVPHLKVQDANKPVLEPVKQ